jgi:cell division septal protein FtsQ
MRKKKSQKVNKNRNTDFNSLNRELGSFGLEPPKRYRENQQANHYVDEIINGFEPTQRSARQSQQANQSRKKSTKNNKKQKSLNKQQQIAYNNKKHKANKLKRKIITIVAVILFTIIVVAILSLTVLFKIDTIKVSGNSIYTNKQITAVLPIEKSENLFLADTKGAKEKLEENLPYVYNAEIKRKFPTTITVTITETPTVYYVKNSDKTYTLLDDNFKVIEEKATKKPTGIRIKKAELKTATLGKTAIFTDKQKKKDLTNLIKEINSLQLENITAIYSVDINNNYMVYDGRITFKLGSTDDLEDKIYSALTATDKLDSENPDASGVLTVTGDKQVYFTEK